MPIRRVKLYSAFLHQVKCHVLAHLVECIAPSTKQASLNAFILYFIIYSYIVLHHLLVHCTASFTHRLMISKGWKKF